MQNKANLAEGPILRHRLDAPLRETKPIGGEAARMGPWAIPGSIAQNKANLEVQQGLEPIVRHRLDAPLRETKPIRWQVVEGKGLMVDWSARRFHRDEPTLLRSNAPNKANSPTADCGLKKEWQRDRPACGCHPAPARAVCTNKPNVHRREARDKSFTEKELW
jgi:hypothetical protein